MPCECYDSCHARSAGLGERRAVAQSSLRWSPAPVPPDHTARDCTSGAVTCVATTRRAHATEGHAVHVTAMQRRDRIENREAIRPVKTRMTDRAASRSDLRAASVLDEVGDEALVQRLGFDRSHFRLCTTAPFLSSADFH
eukprot:1801845-Rhodomonas_salina.2